MIYALHILDQKYIKIGFTEADDALPRIAALQTGNPFEIKLMFTTWGSLPQERTIHSVLKRAFAIAGISIPPNEWYPNGSGLFTGFLTELELRGPERAAGIVDSWAEDCDWVGGVLKTPGVYPAFAALGVAPANPVIAADPRDVWHIKDRRLAECWAYLAKHNFTNAPPGTTLRQPHELTRAQREMIEEHDREISTVRGLSK